MVKALMAINTIRSSYKKFFTLNTLPDFMPRISNLFILFIYLFLCFFSCHIIILSYIENMSSLTKIAFIKQKTLSGSLLLATLNYDFVVEPYSVRVTPVSVIKRSTTSKIDFRMRATPR